MFLLDKHDTASTEELTQMISTLEQRDLSLSTAENKMNQKSQDANSSSKCPPLQAAQVPHPANPEITHTKSIHRLPQQKSNKQKNSKHRRDTGQVI